MQFSKWTGLGNDFIIPEPGETFSEIGQEFSEKVIRLCDRRFGIGADGVVLVTPILDFGIDFSMKIYNADGSEAAMCGNATRCVAKYIRTRGLSCANVVNLHTLSGIVKPEILSNGLVCVDMGAPKDFLGSIFLKADTFEFNAETVSMGNPHAVIFVKDIQKISLETWGPVLERNKQFPDRCNIEFAEIRDENTIRMRVWERGCGITMACGTGSCATLVAAQKRGLIGVEADLILDGGILHIKHEEGTSVFMTGPGQEVFQGTI